MVHSRLRQYRQAFCELLREQLDADGIVFDVIHSNELDGRGDIADIPWTLRVNERSFSIRNHEVTWQPCWDQLRGADLVVVQQATRRLLNYQLLAAQAWGGPRVAFWGHGRNFQATSRIQSVAEEVKRTLSRQAHWFFAYNDLSADVLQRLGFPLDRVTSVGNSIDTRALSHSRDGVTMSDTQALRRHLGLRGRHVGIYCGAMYSEKRIRFLVEAAKQIRSQVSDFELVCVGGGDDRWIVDLAAQEHDWIHAVGPKFKDDLATHFSVANVLLMPGLVGLAVLDSFVLETPLITTTGALHSPEIAYLENGVNGIIVPGDGTGGRYADAVCEALTDDSMYRRLIAGCQRSAQLYSVENMVDRFARGVRAALVAPPRGLARLRSRR